MATRPSSLKYTYEDFLLFPDDGKRHEIIDGEHYVTPSPVSKHQIISSNLHILLDLFARKHNLGRVFAAPFDVVLSNLDVVEPDLIYISNSRAAVVTEKNIQGAPDLVIEILSNSTRRTDEIIKRKVYERFGIGEYWIVDPEVEAIKVFRRIADSYPRVAELTLENEDTLSSPLFPGLTLSLADVFEMWPPKVG